MERNLKNNSIVEVSQSFVICSQYDLDNLKKGYSRHKPKKASGASLNY